MKYEVSIETLTPLHIGSGDELIGDFDYMSPDGSDITYMLNQSTIYAAELERNGARARLDQPAANLVTEADLHDGSRFLRYKVKGGAKLHQLREQLKDVRGAVYVPGSSLKGAFRNAMMTYASTLTQFTTADLKEKNKSKEAAHSWERQLFGPSEQQDVLRALQVADSQSLFPPPLEIIPARVFISAQDDEGSPIEIEAISAQSNFTTSIIIDELALQYVDHPRYGNELPWKDSRLWLINLIPILQEVGRRRIEGELTEAKARGLSRMAKFYEELMRLQERMLGRPAAVIQIGWGTGWVGTTIATALDKPTRDFLRTEYDLGKPPKWNWREKGEWKPDLNKSFPKSRRLQAKDDLPGRPFGWISLFFEQIGKARLEENWEKLQRQAKESFVPMAEHARVKIESRKQEHTHGQRGQRGRK